MGQDPGVKSEARGEAPAGLWRAGAIVFLVALAVRWLHLWYFRRAPFFSLLVGDAQAYDAWARRLAAGDWLGSEVFYQAPALSLPAGRLVRARRPRPAGSAAAPDRARCPRLRPGRRRLRTPLRTGRGVGRGPAARLLRSGDLLRHAGAEGGARPSAGFAPPAAALPADRADRSQKRVLDRDRARTSGAQPGERVRSSAGARALALVALPAAPRAGAPVRRRRRRWCSRRWRCATSGSAASCCLPLRSSARTSTSATTKGRPGATCRCGRGAGTRASNAATRSSSPRRRAGESSLPEKSPATGASRPGPGSRLTPGAGLELLGRKLLLAWNGGEAMDTEDLQTHAEVSPPLSWLSSVPPFGVLAPLALLGIWWTRGRWRELSVLQASIAVYTASLVAFYVVARYRLPLVPMLAPFAGLALVELPARWRRGTASARVRTVWILAGAALIVNLPLLPGAELRALTHLNYAMAFEAQGQEPGGERAGDRPVPACLGARSGERPRAHQPRRARGRAGRARGGAPALPGGGGERPRAGAQSRQPGGRAAGAGAHRGGHRELRARRRARAWERRDALRSWRGVRRGGAARPGDRPVRGGGPAGAGNARARNNLGILLASSGRAAEAIPHFESAVALEPELRDAAENLSRARELAAAGRAAPVAP